MFAFFTIKRNNGNRHIFYNLYVTEQLEGIGKITYRKMFGEYLIYVNDKPVVVVCDNIAYVKKLDCIESKMNNEQVGYPYKGAKEHYILDVDNSDFIKSIVTEVEKVTEVPKKKTKPNQK